MLFSYKGFAVPQKSNDKRQSLISKVKENLNSQSLKSDAKRNESVSTTARIVEAKVADGDIKGAIRILSSESSPRQPTSSIFNELLLKHPAPTRPLVYPPPPDDSLPIVEITTKMVMDGIRNFKNGSAAGLDGIYPQVLKDLTSKSAGDAGKILLNAMTALANLISKGKVTNSILPYFYGAFLISLEKKDGGIRPIAIGNTFRRLTKKMSCRLVKDRLCA